MKTNNKKNAFSLLITLLLTLSMMFSVVYLAHNLHHDCTHDDDCEVCLIIRTVESNISDNSLTVILVSIQVFLAVLILLVDTFAVENAYLIVQQTAAVAVGEKVALQLDTDVTATAGFLARAVTSA